MALLDVYKCLIPAEIYLLATLLNGFAVIVRRREQPHAALVVMHPRTYQIEW